VKPSAAQRRRIIDLFWQGMREPEISDVTGIDIWTVKNVTQSARGREVKPRRCPECGVMTKIVLGKVCMGCHIRGEP
jgi:hypothetical protein